MGGALLPSDAAAAAADCRSDKWESNEYDDEDEVVEVGVKGGKDVEGPVC